MAQTPMREYADIPMLRANPPGADAVTAYEIEYQRGSDKSRYESLVKCPNCDEPSMALGSGCSECGTLDPR